MSGPMIARAQMSVPLIGFQTRAEWGLALETDSSGIWVHFKKFGVRLLAEADPTVGKIAQ